MRKKLIFVLVLMLLPLITLTSCSGNKNNQKQDQIYNSVTDDKVYHDDEEDIDYMYYDARIQYYSQLKKSVLPVVYSDEIFFKDSNVYHHFLAKQSIGLALTSFNLDGDYKDEDDESIGTLYHYLFSTGFDDLRIDDYYKETSEYTVGSAIGNKKIEKDGESYTLFVVAIRGGNYKNEWQSNLSVNSGIRHEGFDSAATLVTDRVLSYISSQNEPGKYKLWITGFSRAGAIANLVAANLNNTLLFDKNSVYAYTFAAPEVVWGEVDTENYTNIYNIMNASDFIPQFVPMQWGYAHYGINKYITGAEFDSKHASKYKLVQDELAEEGITTNYNPNFNLRVRLLFGIFLELAPNEFIFTDYVQPLFLSILVDKSLNNIIHLFRNSLLKWQAENPQLLEYKNHVLNYVINFIPHLLLKDDFMSGYDNRLSSPLLQLAHEHFPELYLYSLYNIPEEEVYNTNNSFSYIILDDDANYFIKDKKSNELLYKIENNQKSITEYAKTNNYDVPYFKINGKSILILPNDVDYEVSYEARYNSNINVKLISYGRIFTSGVNSNDFDIKANKGDTGVLLSVNDGSSTTAGKFKEYTAYEFSEFLGIDKNTFHYQGLLIGLVLLLCIVLSLIVYFVYFIRSKAKKAKTNIIKFSLVALILTAIAEAEMAYFLLADYLVVTVLCKVIAILSLFTLCVISIDLKKTLRNIHKTLIPFIVIMAIGSIVISFNIIAAIAIYIVGVGYLIYYYLSQDLISRNVWIVFALGSLIVISVAMFFIRQFDAQAILIYILAILLLLVVLCASTRVGVNEYPTFSLVVSFIFLMMYLYRDYHFLYSIFYSMLFNFALAMFVIEKISCKPRLHSDIDTRISEEEPEPEPEVEVIETSDIETNESVEVNNTTEIQSNT